MALFGKGKKKPEAESSDSQGGAHPVMARESLCISCRTVQKFSRCWMRSSHVTQCQCCKLPFDNAATLYAKFQPACPRCAEPLEAPGFEYGLCDTCESKHELVDGAKPGLLPNYKQRQERDKHGKSWSKD